MKRSRLVRLLAAAVLSMLLIGLPLAAVSTIGVPLPTWSQLAQSWHQRRVPNELVLRCGAMVFLVLWAWFAATAVAEMVSIARNPGGSRAPLEAGPSGWVRALVRVAVISTVSATAVGGLLPQLKSAADGPALVTAVATEQSAAATSPITAFVSGLGTALLLSAGAVSVLEQRRRRRLRAADIGTRLLPPDATEARTEILLRALDATERMVRLDIAVRSVAVDLAMQGAVVLAAALGDHGEIVLYLDGAAAPSGEMWTRDSQQHRWHLGAHVELEALAAQARGCSQPCPAMVHIGRVPGEGELFVDLEAVGVLSVQSPASDEIIRAIVAALSLSPFLDVAHIVTVGTDDAMLDDSKCEAADSPAAALETSAMAIGGTRSASGGRTTFALRTQGGDEPWEPVVVVVLGQTLDPATVDGVRSVGAGHGLAVVCDSAVGGGWSLVAEGSGHVLLPLGVPVAPVGLTVTELEDVAGLLAAADQMPQPFADVVPIEQVDFVEPEWRLMVRVLGAVEVVSVDGVVAQFERSKSLELVAWLCHHRTRPTRTGARTALWEVDVRDATFANVVSDARRALARIAPPPDGEDWIARTLTEDLPVHDAVVTDADLLAARVAASRGRSAWEAIEVLRPGVELLGGLPFAGTGYLWADAEGIASSHVLLSTGAAAELARHYLAVGDIDGVFWATGQGLKVLAGHEELIALRMRAHAQMGDLAGVRSEWDSYERALVADPWAAAEPSPKLVALRRELLAGERRSA